MMNRNVISQSQQHRNHIRRRVQKAGAVNFFNLLAGPELLEMTDSYLQSIARGCIHQR